MDLYHRRVLLIGGFLLFLLLLIFNILFSIFVSNMNKETLKSEKFVISVISLIQENLQEHIPR